MSEVRDDVGATYTREVEWQTDEKLFPYKNMCAQRKVRDQVVWSHSSCMKRLTSYFFHLQIKVKVSQIESDDVVNAIVDEVTKCCIKRLVIGASSRGMFSRYELKLSNKL